MKEGNRRYSRIGCAFFPPSAPFYSYLRPKCQVRCFCGYLTEEALESQYQPSKFLRLRMAYVGTTCVEIQWSFFHRSSPRVLTRIGHGDFLNNCYQKKKKKRKKEKKRKREEEEETGHTENMKKIIRQDV